MLRQLFARQQGDTIVEVLIAIAVCGAMLGSSYTLVNNTTKTQQQNTEHSEALKLAESQLEALRAMAQSGTNLPAAPAFCLDGTLPPPASCFISNRYTVSIRREAVDTNKFEARVAWDSINGGPQDEVSLQYKVYEATTP